MTVSVFKRGEVTLAHTVYGLILTLATVGELLHEEVTAGDSVAWLLAAGAVLLGAHLFSDVLAHVATTRDEPGWSEILSVSREDVSVVSGAVGAALIMAVAALADLDSEGALMTCVVVGLVALAALCFYGLPQHRLVVRLSMSAVGVAFGAVIVLLENIV
jgi:hypothetical protein